MDNVWLIEEKVWAYLVNHNAYYSTIRYILDGTEYEEIVENDSFMTMEELGFPYESYE